MFEYKWDYTAEEHAVPTQNWSKRENIHLMLSSRHGYFQIWKLTFMYWQQSHTRNNSDKDLGCQNLRPTVTKLESLFVNKICIVGLNVLLNSVL